MHNLEPFYNWRHLYAAEEDQRSLFYGRKYSELEYTQTVYNYYIHPQWDDIGSQTLYVKTLFTDYDLGFVIIEFIGEWNDAIENDVMILKRDIIDLITAQGIRKFILIGENVLNFHSSDDCYYEEWYDDILEDGGWIAMLNLPAQSKHDFLVAKIDRYVQMIDFLEWRTFSPNNLFTKIDNLMLRKLNNG